MTTNDRPQPTSFEINDGLVRRAVQGDTESFGRIVMHYHAPVSATVERLIGGRYPSEVQDVVQDIFHRIHRSLYRWDRAKGASLSTWIYTLVRNFCFDVLKKRRLKTVSLGNNTSDDHPAFQTPDSSPRPDEVLQYAELEVMLDEAIQALPPDQRAVLELRQYSELNYRDIAKRLGLSLGTVKSRLARAKETIRRELGEFAMAS